MHGCNPKRAQQGTVFVPNLVVGCDASWMEAGMDSINQVCDMHSGYHLCERYQELLDLGVKEDICTGSGALNTFYLTSVATKDNIYGCGNVDTQHGSLPVVPGPQPLGPFSFSMSKDSVAKSGKETPWKYVESTRSDQLLDGLYKVTDDQGGVLCCKEFAYPQMSFASLSMLVLSALVLVICAYKGVITLLECISSGLRSVCCPGWTGWDRVIRCCGGRVQIPVTKSAYVHLRRECDLNKLKRECKSYSELLRDGGIAEKSVCVICLEDYAVDSDVIQLKCGHHFHKECCIKWFDEKEKCPICLQQFQKATDKHQQREHLVISVSNSDEEAVATVHTQLVAVLNGRNDGI